ncbi:MAG: carbohydrate ABC transporter permease, partial [Rubrobacteraceae bacterium]
MPSAKSSRPMKEGWAAYLFLLPWFAGLFILTAGPMLASLYLSFTDFDLLTASEWIGLDNYVRMFTEDPHYRNALRVTFTYVFVSVPLTVAFALLLAVILNRGIRALGVYRSVYYLPSLLGGSVAIAIMWRQIFGGEGLVNQILGFFGIDGPSWVSTPDYALYTLIILHVWQFGSPMVIFLAGLKQMPQELYDAAAVDGAKTLDRFFKITVPLLTPLIFFNLVLQMIT